MLKTYQFKIHCKGDSHSCKTANEEEEEEEKFINHNNAIYTS